VRLAGVDAPEVAKHGSPGQHFSREARDFVANKVLNKKGKGVCARLGGWVLV
jgi:endonuclease YncB( thermonuclease family)